MWNSRRLVIRWTASMVLALGVTVARADEQLITLKYVGTDVRKAISMLQTVSDLRVVVDPRVPAKRITLSLKDVSPEDALRTVAAAAGLTTRKLGNAFVVEIRSKAQREADPVKLQAAERANLDAQAREAPVFGGFATPEPPPVGGIVRPDAPAAPAPGGRGGAQLAEIEIPVAVLEALERPVDVDVKNGPLTQVTEQLSRSAGIEVSADRNLGAGLVVTVGLRGIELKSALELVAGQTGLQIAPRPDGVAFVRPGLSLNAVQSRQRQAPRDARHVDQGQLWTAEWARVLTSGISPASVLPAQRSLRRQPANADGRPLEFKPRSGSGRQIGPPAPTGPAAKPDKQSKQDGAATPGKPQSGQNAKGKSQTRKGSKQAKEKKGKATASNR